MKTFEQAIERFSNRSAVVGVLGLGYAGLPLACSFAEAGFTTLGFDVDASKIQKLERGQSYIGHISTERINKLVSSRKLRPQAAFDGLVECDASIICVPTPLDNNRSPDLRFVIETARTIAVHLHRGQLV